MKNITPEIKAVIIHALQNFRGDDLYRARAAFKNCTPAEMQEPYGLSLMTRQQILTEYEGHDKRVIAALEWVNQPIQD